MPVEFSEYRCKKIYKSKRRNIPVFRLVFVIALVVCAIKFSWFSKLVECLPLPGEEEPVLSWDVVCKNEGGKPFLLKDSLVQCSWFIGDSVPEMPNTFLRYLVSQKGTQAMKLHWVSYANDYSRALFVQKEDSLIYTYFNMLLEDSSRAWVESRSGCRFPGLCPALPLEWSSISISDDFDFEGQDRLIAADIFLGLGEAPVHPVLPGVVFNVGKDSLGDFVEIDHGNNTFSKMSGMSLFSSVGDTVDFNSIVGRLPPKDSAAFFLTIRRNGLFVRWNDFYRQTHPVDKKQIAKFKKKIGF